MADFRRSFIVLAALALLLGTAGLVSAQTPFSCTANAASTPLVRGEGIAELTGDLLLRCTGGTATDLGAPVPTANIQIFLNTAITSRLLSGPNDEALLMVDDPAVVAALPASQAQSPCPIGTVCPMYGRGATTPAGSSSYDGTILGARTNRNVFFGQQVPVEPETTYVRVLGERTGVTEQAKSLALAKGDFLAEVHTRGRNPELAPLQHDEQAMMLCRR